MTTFQYFPYFPFDSSNTPTAAWYKEDGEGRLQISGIYGEVEMEHLQRFQSFLEAGGVALSKAEAEILKAGGHLLLKIDSDGIISSPIMWDGQGPLLEGSPFMRFDRAPTDLTILGEELWIEILERFGLLTQEIPSVCDLGEGSFKTAPSSRVHREEEPLTAATAWYAPIPPPRNTCSADMSQLSEDRLP